MPPAVQLLNDVHSSWNRKVHYSLRRSSPLFLSWANRIQSIPLHPNFLIFILILSSRLHLCLPSGFFHSSSPTKTIFSSQHAALPSHLILFDLIILLAYDKEYKLYSSICNFLQNPIIASLFGLHIFLSALLSNTLSLCYSFSVRPSFTPIKTTENLYFCIFKVLRF